LIPSVPSSPRGLVVKAAMPGIEMSCATVQRPSRKTIKTYEKPVKKQVFIIFIISFTAFSFTDFI
jgi:hypothetical protein